MRRRGPRPLGLALDSLTAELEPPTLLAEVQRVWASAAGDAFAAQAQPVAERDGVDHRRVLLGGLGAGARPASRSVSSSASTRPSDGPR